MIGIFIQVVWYDGKVYSACELLDQTNQTQAVGMGIDEYKQLLFDSGSWAEGNRLQYTNTSIIDFIPSKRYHL